MITETEVRAALNEIVDPCSTAAGCEAGLDEMGLVRKVELTEGEQGTDVRVIVGVTEYGCLMGGPFVREAYLKLEALAGIGKVTVDLDTEFDWDRDDMSAGYQARLQAHRERRGFKNIPVVVTRAGT